MLLVGGGFVWCCSLTAAEGQTHLLRWFFSPDTKDPALVLSWATGGDAQLPPDKVFRTLPASMVRTLPSTESRENVVGIPSKSTADFRPAASERPTQRAKSKTKQNSCEFPSRFARPARGGRNNTSGKEKPIEI